MAHALTPNRLSYLNLRRRPFRTFALIFAAAVLSSALFGGTVLSLSLKNGLDSVKARFGADLIVVPPGHEQDQESILLAGEPSYFYFDKEITKKLQGVEGISGLSAQFYLTSLGEECCSLRVQIIGFDPATDFSIQPWIHETIGGDLEDGAFIIGSDIPIDDGKHIKFYDIEYPVAAKLDETGTGLDQSVFATMETIQDLYYCAKEKGVHFLKDTNPDTSISSVLVKVSEGYDIDQAAANIRKAADGVRIVRTQSLITNISKSLDGITSLYYVFALVFLGIAMIILALVFSSSANERKKEFATLRILGAERKKLAAILLWESLYVSVTGAVTGIALAAVFVFPFNVFIGDSIGLPYVQPSPAWILAILTGTLLVAAAIGPIASAYSAVKISRPETYLTLREGE